MRFEGVQDASTDDDALTPFQRLVFPLAIFLMYSIDELVAEGRSGLVFDTSEELAEQLQVSHQRSERRRSSGSSDDVRGCMPLSAPPRRLPFFLQSAARSP